MAEPFPAPQPRARAHDHILASTRALLAEVGYDAVTMEKIAARAGVGKQTLYRWWPSRAAVVLDSFLDETGGQRIADVPRTTSVHDDLVCYLSALTARLAEPGFASLAHVLTSEMLRTDTAGPDLVQRIVNEGRAPLLERLSACESQLRVSPEIAADLLAGPLYYRWMMGTGELNDEFVRACVSAVMRP